MSLLNRIVRVFDAITYYFHIRKLGTSRKESFQIAWNYGFMDTKF